jgi:hypothetical protein
VILRRATDTISALMVGLHDRASCADASKTAQSYVFRTKLKKSSPYGFSVNTPLGTGERRSKALNVQLH